jgi:hypothetical protein
VSAATVQKCGENDFVLFTNVAKYTDWIQSEINATNDNVDFESIFNALDEILTKDDTLDAECRYEFRR